MKEKQGVFGLAQAIREHYHEVRCLSFLVNLRRDLRFALRMLAKSPALLAPLFVILCGSLPSAAQELVPDSCALSLNDNTALVFYAEPSLSPSFWPPFFAALRGELAQSSPSWHLPATPCMIVAGRRSVDADVSSVIVVHLEGRCDRPVQDWRPPPPGSALGWVYQAGGRIQPFIFVDCARISQLLFPAVFGLSNSQRASSMNTAIARVLLHEWIHINLQTAGHASHGIRQSALSAQDLIGTENRRAARDP